MLSSSLLVLLQLSSTLGDAPPPAQSVATTVESQQQFSFLGDGGRLLEEKKLKRKFCNTTAHGNLKGDYAYEACGAFCKATKATNHCRFCKCKACSFCKLVEPPLRPKSSAGGAGRA